MPDVLAQFIGRAISSALLGLLIGAFYGHKELGAARVWMPVTLWAVGCGFIAVQIVWGVISTEIHVDVWVLRAVLWSILVLCLPLGRLVRVHFEIWRLHRRREHVRKHYRNGGD